MYTPLDDATLSVVKQIEKENLLNSLVDEVGTILPGPASVTFGINNFILEDLYKTEFFLTLCLLK